MNMAVQGRLEPRPQSSRRDDSVQGTRLRESRLQCTAVIGHRARAQAFVQAVGASPGEHQDSHAFPSPNDPGQAEGPYSITASP